MSEVRIRLLGGFAATVDGVPVPDRRWRLRKARELVKMLALARGHRLHREQAMELLWPERDAAAAANNLNQVVHAARRALGAEAIESSGEMLALAAQVDVDELERAASAARRARTPTAYREALERDGGELLPENRYDDWAAARRGELAGLIDELRAELAAAGGDAAGPRGLPAETSSFVGRGHELGELAALLARGRLLTLAGTGGAGKTRLALELARRCAPSYADGAALTELADVSDPAMVVDAVGAALDVRALAGRPLLDAVIELLAARELLLVVDNCEHVLGASAALVERLLRGAPRLTVLATSREPLRVPGEVVFRVPSLAIPDPEGPLDPADLPRFEAVRLFVERAAAAAPGFALDEANAAAVARICFRLDGLPLALELAAGRLGALSPAAVATRLDDRFRLLRAGSSTAPTRQQTLSATLQWSHDLLGPEEVTLLRRLSVFAGGFELEAVEEVCAGDGVDPAEVADLLARLVEKSLVTAEDRDGERRYRLLETIRADARARLGEAGEVEGLAKRHARWAFALAEREGPLPRLDRDEANLRVALDVLLAVDPPEALRFCTALWPFWLRRIDLAEAHRRFAEALAGCSRRTAARADGLLASAAVDLRAGAVEGVGERARESLEIAAEIGDAAAEWRALQFLVGVAVVDDDPRTARRWLDRAIALARRARFPAAEALGVYSLGVVDWVLGDLATAEARIAASLEALRALGDSPERIPAPLNIAETLAVDGPAGPGLRVVFEETRQPFLDMGPREAVGYVLANLANLVRATGDLARARSLLDEGLAHFARDGDERGLADVLGRRGHLELAAGAPAEAERCFERALTVRRARNDRRGVGMVLAALGLTATVTGHHAAAERHLAESRDIFRRAGDRWGLSGALWRTADLALARGRPDDAEAALQEALTVLDMTGRNRWIALTLCALAESAALRGDLERADALLAEAGGLFAEQEDVLAREAVGERRGVLAKAARRARKAGSRTTPATGDA